MLPIHSHSTYNEMSTFISAKGSASTSDPDPIDSKCAEYETAQVGNSSFEKKNFRKLAEKLDNKWHLQVRSLADKISFCEDQEVKEAGITLTASLLDFSEQSRLALAVSEHLDELVQSKAFLDKCINLDPFAVNQGAKILSNFAKVINLTARRSEFIKVDAVPEDLIVNPDFISDPRIKLYNIYSKAGNTELSSIDDTIEMEVAFILADLREQFVQRLIPQNHKDRSFQEIYIKNKLQNRLSLKNWETKDLSDEKIINIYYKRMSLTALTSYILDGASSQDQFRFTDIACRVENYIIPIAKRKGYANPEILIDHVHFAINNSEKISFKISFLKEKMDDYFDKETTSITKLGVKALLYSTGYLKMAERKPQRY